MSCWPLLVLQDDAMRYSFWLACSTCQSGLVFAEQAIATGIAQMTTAVIASVDHGVVAVLPLTRSACAFHRSVDLCSGGLCLWRASISVGHISSVKIHCVVELIHRSTHLTHSVGHVNVVGWRQAAGMEALPFHFTST